MGISGSERALARGDVNKEAERREKEYDVSRASLPLHYTAYMHWVGWMALGAR